MKIGIDLRAINETAIYRGIGTYVMSMTRALSITDTNNEYYLFLYSFQADFAHGYLPHGSRWHFVFLNPPTFKKRKFVRTIALGNTPLDIRRFDLDVIYQLDKNFPIKTGATPIVSIVYDLIPQILHDIYQPPIRLRYNTLAGSIIYMKEHRLRRLANQSAGKAHQASRKVIVISNHTGKDVVEIAGVKPERVRAIPLAADAPISTLKPKRPTAVSPKHRYILYVGGVDPRKRIPYLVEQFASLSTKYPDLDLVIVGKEATDKTLPHARKLQHTIKRLSLGKRVILTGYTADEELLYLYRHAEAFVFPSMYEGFGLPILEAFQAGCPVIAYSNSSIPEVAGDAALLVPEGEPLTPAIETLLNDTKLRRTMVAKGYAQAANFTWEQTARQTLAVLEEAARKR